MSTDALQSSLSIRPRAIIFDFDGLLVDTEWAIYRSWARVYESEGHDLPLDLFNSCLGSGYTHWNPGEHLEKLTGKTYDWTAIDDLRQTEIVRDLEHEGLLPGAIELLDHCAASDIPLAVASSSSRRWVGGWLEKLGIIHRFQGIYCRTDGYAVKPAPDLFLAALQCLGTPGEQTLILEDSRNGTLAAREAGIPCIVIPNRVTRHADLSPATARTDSLHSVHQWLAELS